MSRRSSDGQRCTPSWISRSTPRSLSSSEVKLSTGAGLSLLSLETLAQASLKQLNDWFDTLGQGRSSEEKRRLLLAWLEASNRFLVEIGPLLGVSFLSTTADSSSST